MNRISSYHFFSLMVMFELGTTIIFGSGSAAGRDAWISSVISSLLGGMLIVGYTVIARLNKYAPLVEWYTLCFGKWLGTVLAWLYPLFFIYTAARVICDIRFLLPLTLLPKTPAWVFIGVLVLLLLYCLFAGVEVLFQISGILLPILVVFIMLEVVVLLASDSLHGDYLRPVLSGGMGRVTNQVWPVGVTTTYGECYVMGAFWYMLRKKQYAGRIGFCAAIFAGVFVVLFNILAITALGEYLFQRMIFPAYAILTLSSIADFLENLEVLGAIYFLCSAFVKIAVYLFSAVFCIRELTHSSKDRSAIWIATISTYIIAMTMANNLSEHLQVWVGKMAQVIVAPMYVVLPGIMLIISLVRTWKRWGTSP